MITDEARHKRAIAHQVLIDADKRLICHFRWGPYSAKRKDKPRLLLRKRRRITQSTTQHSAAFITLSRIVDRRAKVARCYPKFLGLFLRKEDEAKEEIAVGKYRRSPIDGGVLLTHQNGQ